MSKVFVIPDVHLKPWMFDKAEELLSRSEYDKIVCLGDLVDDWDQEKNLGLYSETFDALERFINRHPNFRLNFVEKCAFSFKDQHRITYKRRSSMNICLNLKKEEPKKITTTKELAQYILESGNDVEKMHMGSDPICTNLSLIYDR